MVNIFYMRVDKKSLMKEINQTLSNQHDGRA